MSCKCHPLSPFRWKEDGRLSIFAEDKAYTPCKNGSLVSKSQASTAVVERERAAGRNTGTVSNLGIGKEAREKLAARQRDFHYYARAGKDKVKFDAAA